MPKVLCKIHIILHFAFKNKELYKMKLLTKFLALMLICTTAMSITSCLGDSNDNDYSEYQITPEKYTLYLNEMAGNYTGKMYFYNDTIWYYQYIS